MILLTSVLRATLRANAEAASRIEGFDPVPAVKFFNPLGAFATPYRLSTWAACARRAGSIMWAETLLKRAASPPGDELPDPSTEGEG